MILIKENKETLKGKCSLKFGDVTVNSTFVLYYLPRVIYLVIPFSPNAIRCYGYGEFTGTLNFKKISINCSKIAFSKVFDKKVSFLILDDLYINESSVNKNYEANLIGCYAGSTSFQFKNLEISIGENPNKTRINKFCADYGNVLEGNTLKIKSSIDENIDIEVCRELTKETCILYSLISGSIVTFNRCETYNLTKIFPFKKDKTSIWRIKTYYQSRGSQCINLFDFGNALALLLDNFNGLSFDDKKCYYTVIEYLNSSPRYLEDSVLNIAQAWEIMAEHFASQKFELNTEMKLLKSKLKSAIKEWKKENNIESSDISNRVITSLYWNKVIKKIEDLIATENLNIEKLKVDFKKLIEIRNSIVHTGRFRIIGEEDNTMSLINSSVLTLQILILSKLGYNGEIIFQENIVWRTREISFFKN